MSEDNGEGAPVSEWATSEVKRADETFLKQVYDYEPTSTYDSAARYAALSGIGTKYLGELVLGPIYPRFKSNQAIETYNTNRRMANANSQTTIGIWEDMGRHGMMEVGENITPSTLYGKKIGDLSVQNQ
ncbi:hypothetical protein ACJJTC_016551 [Scirpophaga incertulas]